MVHLTPSALQPLSTPAKKIVVPLFSSRGGFPPSKLRGRKRSFKHVHRSAMTAAWACSWESKEEEKVHHARFCEAVIHADELNEWYAYVEFPFQPYWSRKHQCYHVGRNKRIGTATAIEFLGYSRARARLLHGNPSGHIPAHLRSLFRNRSMALD